MLTTPLPSSILARRGMVATSQPLAVEAGLSILRMGGNAADAAIAAAAALNVTEPCSTGLGGDCFAIYYNARTREIQALNGSGHSPRNLTLDHVLAEGPTLHPYSAHTVTVPGACAGWCDIIDGLGALDLPTVLAPAIRLARDGFPVSPITAEGWARGLPQLQRSPGGADLLIDGEPPRAGQIFRNPHLAHTLERVAAGGGAAFYEGEIADAIVRCVSHHGGLLDHGDLAAHRSTWETPLSVSYRDMRVHECPPNGQGLAALIALGILETFDVARLEGADRLHLMIEAMRLAFADARYYVADPHHRPAPLDALLSEAYLAKRAATIDLARANPDPRFGVPTTSSDTVYLCVVDGEGNACSFINSNYMGFGSGLVPAGCGFSLQNRGHNFALDPSHANALAPHKRPYHTIIPGLITHPDGRLFAPFGVMGGFMQPQGHLQVVHALLDGGDNPQVALDRPRFCIKSDGVVALEQGLPDDIAAALEARGHRVEPVAGSARSIFGRGQIIARDEAGVLWGGSDRRADGCAMGW